MPEQSSRQLNEKTSGGCSPSATHAQGMRDVPVVKVAVEIRSGGIHVTRHKRWKQDKERQELPKTLS